MDRDSERAPITAAQNEARDEEALRRGEEAVRVSVLSDAVLSVGVGVREDDRMLERARRTGIPVLRRSTGGTGVLHGPGDLVWSVVVPRGDSRTGPDLSAAYARLGAGCVAWLDSRGHRSAWVPAPAISPNCCVLGERGRVLALGDRILGGAAQHLSAHHLLHHGMIPRRIDRAAHRAVFDFAESSDLERLISTEELGIREPPGALAAALEQAIRDALGADRAQSV